MVIQLGSDEFLEKFWSRIRNPRLTKQDLKKKLFKVYLPFYVKKAFASQLLTLLKSESELNNITWIAVVLLVITPEISYRLSSNFHRHISLLGFIEIALASGDRKLFIVANTWYLATHFKYIFWEIYLLILLTHSLCIVIWENDRWKSKGNWKNLSHLCCLFKRRLNSLCLNLRHCSFFFELHADPLL